MISALFVLLKHEVIMILFGNERFFSLAQKMAGHPI